jgi:hypothetical protein
MRHPEQRQPASIKANIVSVPTVPGISIKIAEVEYMQAGRRVYGYTVSLHGPRPGTRNTRNKPLVSRLCGRRRKRGGR